MERACVIQFLGTKGYQPAETHLCTAMLCVSKTRVKDRRMPSHSEHHQDQGVTCVGRYCSIRRTDRISSPATSTSFGHWSRLIPSDAQVNQAVSGFFQQQPSELYEKGSQCLVTQWDTCLNAGSEFVWVSSVDIIKSTSGGFLLNHPAPYTSFTTMLHSKARMK
jgi:hypothetical protein